MLRKFMKYDLYAIGKCFNNSAMTFVEVLIVTSLMAVVSLSLYHVFDNGIRVWERSQDLVLEEDVAIFFEKVTRDLHNMFISSEGLVGDRSVMIIPVFLEDSFDEHFEKDKRVLDQEGRVYYFYDEGSKNIYQKKSNYRQIFLEKEEYFYERVCVRNVEELRFEYYYLTQSYEDIRMDTIIEGRIPNRISVEVVYFDKGYQRSMKKFIDIPLSVVEDIGVE